MPSDIEQADHVLNNLRQKREAIVARGRELSDERAALALAGHTGDKVAAKRLQEICAALGVHSFEIDSIDVAIAVAEKHRAAAERDAAAAVAKKKAAECAKVVDELAPVFEYVDKHFKAVVDGLLAIEMGFKQLREHGVAHPTDVQVRLNVVTGIHTWAMQMPKNWHSELRNGMRFLAPHERRDFSTYWKAIEPMLQNTIRAKLGEPQPSTTKEEATA